MKLREPSYDSICCHDRENVRDRYATRPFDTASEQLRMIQLVKGASTCILIPYSMLVLSSAPTRLARTRTVFFGTRKFIAERKLISERERLPASFLSASRAPTTCESPRTRRWGARARDALSPYDRTRPYNASLRNVAHFPARDVRPADFSRTRRRSGTRVSRGDDALALRSSVCPTCDKNTVIVIAFREISCTHRAQKGRRNERARERERLRAGTLT